VSEVVLGRMAVGEVCGTFLKQTTVEVVRVIESVLLLNATTCLSLNQARFQESALVFNRVKLQDSC